MTWHDEPLPASYLRLEQGKHEIKILSVPTFRTQEMPDGKVVERADFEVEYKGEKTVWSMTKGSEKSMFGKLHKIAGEHGGLIGKTVTVRATGEKLNRQYWVELKESGSEVKPSGDLGVSSPPPSSGGDVPGVRHDGVIK